MDELIKILEKIKPGVDFVNSNGIIDQGLLDSLGVIRLASEICDRFDIEIPVTELIPENFNSLEAMMDMIHRLEDE